MSKGLEIMGKLAQAVHKYHSEGSAPHESAMGGALKKPLAEGPSGPDHSGKEHSPAGPLAEHDQDYVHNTDMEKLQEVICPGCHDKLRAHLVAAASGSQEPNKALR